MTADDSTERTNRVIAALQKYDAAFSVLSWQLQQDARWTVHTAFTQAALTLLGVFAPTEILKGLASCVAAVLSVLAIRKTLALRRRFFQQIERVLRAHVELEITVAPAPLPLLPSMAIGRASGGLVVLLALLVVFMLLHIVRAAGVVIQATI